MVPDLFSSDSDILQRIDERTQRTDDRVQELYDAVVGTLEESGIQERLRDHDRRIQIIEARIAGLANRLVILLTGVLTALASSWAYLKMQGRH